MLLHDTLLVSVQFHLKSIIIIIIILLLVALTNDNLMVLHHLNCYQIYITHTLTQHLLSLRRKFNYNNNLVRDLHIFD